MVVIATVAWMIQRQDYVPTEWLHRKKRRRKSPIDPYGRRLTKVVGNREKGDFWICYQCDNKKEISLYALVNSGTSGALRHLRKDHHILVGEVDSETTESEPPRRRQRQRTVLDLQKQAVERLAIPKSKAELFKDLLLRWIVDADIPFSAVEHTDFRKLLSSLNEELVDELFPRSGVTIRSWLEAEYRSQKELLRSKLAASLYKKHLTFDLWTSLQEYGLLGVTVHFTDALKRPQTSLLALRRLRGAHSGENIGSALREVLSDDSDRVFPGPEIEGPEREIRVGDAPLRFAAAQGSSPPASPPAAQSQRPQRNVGLPHKYRDSVIDLPGRPVGSINPPVALEDSSTEEVLEQGDGEEEGSQRQRREIWSNLPSKPEIAHADLRAIRGCITCAIYKLEKYVILLEDSPAYWTAMILHPAFKDKWIREYLPGEHANRIVDSFKRFFERDYNKLPTQPTPIQKKPKSSHLGAHSYLAQRPSPANRDEVKQYLEEPIYEDEAVEDPFEYWRQREKDFPRLARMAYDLLSIPSTACECERAFSLAKLLVGTQRHSLQDLTMEMLTCVKFWRRNPLI
ncbi:hypothetical protein FPOA_14115 [Fusarium poae]|uniref:HAT C-terminal dimerisation domain-containing protein n=1 Tax=Fusarium poae TaxID=36050 RepID=A0A1B8A3Q4_FUSPO|nr:hypothetical protein FPOA_14119 [Fusarium poae]OBS15104.1 hypothetical protein FPOA_14115 [Fusarium poae]